MHRRSQTSNDEDQVRAPTPLAGLCTLASATLPVRIQAQNTQQLVFTGLRSVASQGQFNAVQTDPSGNLYLLLDQKDGVRLLKTDPTATNILAQAQIGAAGDIGLALALDPAGNIYITGTTTSSSLTTSSGVVFPARADASTNSFVAKFDTSLNPLFVTYTGSGRTATTSIAATADAVFVTGSTFSTTLPVTPSGIIQSPASGSFQNGFVEKFNTTGATLLYATYLSALNGDTAPSAIAADANDNAYIAGYTTSSGHPTLNALIPDILTTPPSTTSGFLTKLPPAGDGIVFSTFIPGTGITSLVLDSTAQNLLLSGTISLGQFPIASVPMPLVSTTYQSALRISLDGTTVLASTLAAPGTQSTITPAPAGAAWITGPLTTPLLPIQTLSTFGNADALRITAQSTVDQTLRFGGLPTSNPAYSSAPVTLTSVATDPTGEPIFAGSADPTTSSSLLTTQTYDIPLYSAPTTALPSTLRNAVLAPGTCNGSLCAGSAAYLTKLNPSTSAPSLALSTDASPNITLRNLGSATATNLQITATGFTSTHNCPTALPPAAECSIALTGAGPGTIAAQADNATTQTATLPATTATANPIVFIPKELDFGIQTSTSPATTRTITITNLGTQTKTFTSNMQALGTPPYTLTQSASDCPLATSTTKSLDPGATCHIILSLTTSSAATNDGPIQANWTIGSGSVLLTAYSQAASLSISASEIDFGTQYTPTPTPNLNLPRYLYLSNNSATAIPTPPSPSPHPHPSPSPTPAPPNSSPTPSARSSSPTNPPKPPPTPPPSPSTRTSLSS
ncbi:MAG TPA: SBBP repeat-containing protein [Edaphobacter sp.]